MVLLRWLAIIATSYVVLFGDASEPASAAAPILLILLLSNVALHFVPARQLLRTGALTTIVLFDSAMTSLVLVLSPGVEENIVVLYFFVILVAATGSTLRGMIVVSLVISVLYLAALWNTHGAGYVTQSAVLLRVPFLFAASLFYAHLAENSRQKESALFRAIFESSLDAIVVNRWDDGRYVEVNDAFLRVSGFERDEVLGCTPRALDIWAEETAFREALQRLRKSETVRDLETLFRMKDGRLVSALISMTHAYVNDKACVVSFVRDVSELQEAQRARRENEERFRQLAENIDGVFWMISRKPPRLLYINGAYERIWGRSSEPLHESLEHLFETVHPEDRDRVSAALRDWVRRPEEHQLSERYRILWPDGQTRWIWARGFVIRDAAGRPARLGGIAQDITEFEQLEERLLQTQKMEAIGRLAAGVAHDFNNLLTVIRGTASALMLRSPADMRADMQAIDEAATRAAELTGQLLAFGRRERTTPRVIDLNEAVESMRRMLGRILGEDVELTCVLGERLGRIRLDPTHVEQVLMNLAVNARDAMPDGGRLAIETANVAVTDRDARTYSLPPGEYARLTVSDSGCGMTEAVKSRIFEPFFTTKEGKGTGLGLATVYAVVTQGGGHLLVESEPGRGASFRLCFPLVKDAENGPAGTRQGPSTLDRGHGAVLVVEDEPSVRRMTVRILEEHGYTVRAASSAEEAIKMTENDGTRPCDWPCDLAVVDVIMPGRRGTELASWLEQVFPEVKVVMMSGYPEATSAAGAAISNRRWFLQKPFTPQVLLATVGEALGSSGPHTA